MNNKELRLSNIIGVSWLEDKTPLQGIHCIVESISSLTIEASVFSCGDKINNKTQYKLKECVGIPLTEDWLINLGFKCFPWGWVKKENEDISVLINFHNKPQGICAWLEVGNGLRANFDYVHQLQNLYFALTGVELVLNN
jgi:hypothetical protein